MNKPVLAASTLLAALAFAACGSSSHKSSNGSASAQTGGSAGSSSQRGGSASNGGQTTSPTPAQLGCSSTATLCVTKNTAFKPKGTSYIDANIEKLMASGQPKLKNPIVTCPQAQIYPVKCQLTGSAKIGTALRPVKGTVTVLGVVVQTRTYAYEVYYAPTAH